MWVVAKVIFHSPHSLCLFFNSHIFDGSHDPHAYTHRNHIILVFLVRICCSSYQQNFLILKLLNMYVTAFNIYNLREMSHCEFHLVLTNCSINFYLKEREKNVLIVKLKSDGLWATVKIIFMFWTLCVCDFNWKIN